MRRPLAALALALASLTTARAAELAPEAPIASPAEVRAAARASAAGLRTCFALARRAAPTIALRVAVAPDGRAAATLPPEAMATAVGRCISRRVDAWRLPVHGAPVVALDYTLLAVPGTGR